MQKIDKGSASAIARYEYHGDHPGIHGHTHCDRGGVESGPTGLDKLPRIPCTGGDGIHRRVQDWTQDAFWESAKQFFRLREKKGPLL